MDDGHDLYSSLRKFRAQPLRLAEPRYKILYWYTYIIIHLYIILLKCISAIRPLPVVSYIPKCVSAILPLPAVSYIPKCVSAILPLLVVSYIPKCVSAILPLPVVSYIPKCVSAILRLPVLLYSQMCICYPPSPCSVIFPKVNLLSAFSL